MMLMGKIVEHRPRGCIAYQAKFRAKYKAILGYQLVYM
jgi:hypothetical protein